MGTREMCNECGEFFIIGAEDEQCPHGNVEDSFEEAKVLTEDEIKEVGAIWKQKHEMGEIDDNEYDRIAEAFGMLYKKFKKLR